MFTLSKLLLTTATIAILGTVAIPPARSLTLNFSLTSPTSWPLNGSQGSLTVDDSVANLKFGDTAIVAGTIKVGNAEGGTGYLVKRDLGWNFSTTPAADTWKFGSWLTMISWQMNISCNFNEIDCSGSPGFLSVKAVNSPTIPNPYLYIGGIVVDSISWSKQPVPSVPEPGNLLGFLLVGGAGLLQRQWKHLHMAKLHPTY